ncbi:unnamed protein product [Cladocopium goreaui]|uniref:Uncharacterized protein n=1 Tax=Cladocopium goreaui TaxID=2562237 RepID=A0A9P1FT61_9DINO|nr:unnamed protein product [Cladocopium goreaui]
MPFRPSRTAFGSLLGSPACALLGSAIATICHEVPSPQGEVIEQWDNFEWLMNLTQCLKINSRTTRFRKRHVVRITRAANPSDILWENLSASHQTRFWLRGKTYAFVALRLAARLGDAWKFVGGLCGDDPHPTKTGQDVSLLAKLSLFYLGLGIARPKQVVPGCITIPLYILFSCKLLVRNFMRDQRLDLQKFQSFFELPDMDQTRPANAKVILTFVMGFVFMPVWPYAILIACAALFLEYWAFKYQLLRHSKRPYWRRCRQCGPEDSHGFSTLPWRVMVLHRSIQTPPGSGGWCWTVLDGAGWCK